jgi:gelsolin
MASSLPIEETNLAAIGSTSDHALKALAASIDFHWSNAGSAPGIEIWRVHNKRTEADNPDFGIEDWPVEMYGQFHRGDSYIVLLTRKDEEGEGLLLWDVFFWIGSESSQDEYGVAAYKANELGESACCVL